MPLALVLEGKIRWAWSRTETLNARYKNRFDGCALANSTNVVVLPEPAKAATLTTSVFFNLHRTIDNCSSVKGVEVPAGRCGDGNNIVLPPDSSAERNSTCKRKNGARRSECGLCIEDAFFTFKKIGDFTTQINADTNSRTVPRCVPDIQIDNRA